MSLVAHGHKPEAHAVLTAPPGKYHHYTRDILVRDMETDWLRTTRATAL